MIDGKHFIKHYLLSRRLFLYLYLLFFASLFLFRYLFEGSRLVLLYLTVILLFLGVVFLLWDVSLAFQAYRKESLYEDSQPESPLEVLLADKVEALKDENRSQQAQVQARLSDLMDYYSLWVHQIKTPIAASKLLLEDLDGQVKQQLEQEIFKIDSYANLVLHYLRLESFHDDLLLKQESLDELVKEVVRKYAIFFIQKGISLHLHDLEVSVLTDKKWLLVMIEQILSNSLKYTSQGQIEIYYEDATLYLRDTGIGIKNSDIIRVFERGFSGYNGRLTQQSSGLGLYLSKKIADQLGHSIHIQSQVGQGTTVKIGFEEQKLILK